MAYNLRTNEILLDGKFQPPNFNGVAVHRSQPEGQTKRGLSNICLDKKNWLDGVYEHMFSILTTFFDC